MADLAKQLAALPKAQPLDLAFNASFGSRMVLQQAPARAAVYGTVRCTRRLTSRCASWRAASTRCARSSRRRRVHPAATRRAAASCGTGSRLPPTPTTTSREHTIIAHASSNTSASPRRARSSVCASAMFGYALVNQHGVPALPRLRRRRGDGGGPPAASKYSLARHELQPADARHRVEAASCSWSKDGDKAARWLSAHDATANRTVGCDLSAALPACAGRATPLGAFSAFASTSPLR